FPYTPLFRSSCWTSPSPSRPCSARRCDPTSTDSSTPAPRSLPSVPHEPGEEAPGVVLQRGEVIATLLGDDGGHAQRRDALAEPGEALRAHLDRGLRILHVDVEAMGEDDGLRCKPAARLDRAIHMLEEAVFRCAMRHGEVQVEALPLAGTGLLLETRHHRIEVHRTGMHRDRHHVGAVVEDVLRALAMMD